MPPALSDYNSSSDSDTHQIAASQAKRKLPVSKSPLQRLERKTASTDTASRKRKHSSLLSGLDPGNIIMSDDMIHSTAEGTAVSSSAPALSYPTRGSTNGTRPNELAYDQRYHPMDEYLRPSQAAKRRAEHGLEDDDDCTDFKDDDHDESDSDIGEQPQFKKHKKLDSLAARQGTRRSSRQVNRDVLYNTNVHPADEQLAQMSIDNGPEEVSDDEGPGSAESSISADGDGARESSVHAGDIEEREIPETDDEASDLSASSPLHSTPLSSITFDNAGRRTPLSDLTSPGGYNHRFRVEHRLEVTPFHIYEDSVEEHMARAVAPEPIEYEEDNKENIEVEPVAARDPLDSITIRPATDAEMNDYLHPSMFDGASDDIGAPNLHGTTNLHGTPNLRGTANLHGTANLRVLTNLPTPTQAPNDERDSVLGSPTPSPRSNVGSMRGMRSPRVFTRPGHQSTFRMRDL